MRDFVRATVRPLRRPSSCTRARRVSVKVTTSVRPRSFVRTWRSSAGRRRVTAGGGACSTSTGGGLNSSESSTGGASGMNCSAASFGRNVIVPANAGSVLRG